jgi:hypothetical protein
MTVLILKAYPRNLTAEVWFAIDEVNRIQQHIQIHYTLIRNQSITDFRIYIIIDINKFIDLLYPNTFPSTISFFRAYSHKNQQWLWRAYCSLISIISLSLEITLFSFSISDKTTHS